MSEDEEINEEITKRCNRDMLMWQLVDKYPEEEVVRIVAEIRRRRLTEEYGDLHSALYPVSDTAYPTIHPDRRVERRLCYEKNMKNAEQWARDEIDAYRRDAFWDKVRTIAIYVGFAAFIIAAAVYAYCTYE